jgi:hypothetical protein
MGRVIASNMAEGGDCFIFSYSIMLSCSLGKPTSEHNIFGDKDEIFWYYY